MSRNVLLTTISRCAMVVAGFGSSIISARVLGPTGRGDFYFVVTVAATVVQFGNLGLHSSNTYLVSRDRRLLGPLVANSLWVSLVVGLLGGVVTVAILRVFNPIPNAPATDIWYVIALGPPLLFFLLGANLLVGVNRIGTFNVIEALGRLLVVAAFAAAAAVATHAGAFLLANTLAWTGACAVLLWALIRDAGSRLTFDTNVFVTGFRYAAKAYLVALLGFLVLRSSVFLLERMTTAKEVGFFSISAQIADVLAIIPTSVALVLFPDLVRSVDRRWSLTMRSCAIVFAVLAAVCVVVAIVAGPLIRIVYGPGFGPAVGILDWLLPGVVGLGVTSVLSQYVAAIGMPKIVVAVWAAMFALAVVLGFFLIKRHGVHGAAQALSITYWVSFALMLGVADRYRRLYARQERAPSTGAVAVEPDPEPPWL